MEIICFIHNDEKEREREREERGRERERDGDDARFHLFTSFLSYI